MLSERLLAAVSGSVHFYVQGGFVTRFLALCAEKSVRLRHTGHDGDRLYGTVGSADLANLKTVAKNSGMQLVVLEKKGLSFFLHRYRLRWGIPVGLSLAFVLFFVLSSMVWQVDVIGCRKLSEEYVLSYFEDLGVRTGVFQKSIDMRTCREKAMREIEDLLWVTVYLKGCTAVIELTERNAEVILPQEGCSNLIASYGGEIVRADVYAGEAYVQNGQAVAKGDLLVGGAVPLKNGGVRFVRSQADIVARTNRALQTTVSFKTESLVIKKTAVRYVLNWFGLRIPLGFRFGSAVAESTHLQAQINDVRLPVSLYRQGLRKQVRQQLQKSENLALLQCFSMYAMQETEEMQDKTVLRRTLRVERQNDGVTVCGEYICEENIVRERELLIEDEK